jgi:two-component system response regulator YesN
MYRVLIVDDEPFVVDWVSNLLEGQTEPELDICRAYSGQMAIDWFKRTKIDIIITDMNMPEMNGIELVNKVHSNWPHCKVIILTAHAEFDYAYFAIKNNVVGFVLKNKDDQSILNEISKATKLLDAELDKRSQLGEDWDYPYEPISVIRNEILSRIIKRDGANIHALFSQLDDAGVSFSPELPFLVMIGCIENQLSEVAILERHRQYGKVKSIVELFLKSSIRCYPAEHGENKLIWIMQPNDLKPGSGKKEGYADYEQAAVFVGGMLDTIQSSCMETAGIRVSFILHDESVYFAKLPDVLAALDRLMNLLLVDQSGFIVTGRGNMDEPAKIQAQFDSSDPYMAENTVKKLKNLLYSGKYEEFQGEMGSICEIIGELNNKYSGVIQELYYSIAVFISSYVNQQKIKDELAGKVELSEMFRLYDTSNWRQATDKLKRIASAIVQIHGKEDNHALIAIVNSVKRYVDRNISGDVSLTQLSRVTGYNSSYLSRIFKQQTGMTIKEYICKQKLDGIVALFAATNISINEIAAKMGFSTRAYFNNFFRRMTGVSPQEYRRSLQ